MQYSGREAGRVDSIFNTVNQGDCEVWELQRFEGRERNGIGEDSIFIASHDGKKSPGFNIDHHVEVLCALR